MNNLFVKLINYSLQQVLVFGLVIGMAYYFLVFDDGASQRGQIASLENEVIQEEEKKKDTDANLQEEARMKAAVGLLSQQYQEISRRLPTNLSSIELNRNVDAFARNSGASIKSRKPLEVNSGEIVDEVPIEVSLEGNFAELAQFVYLVSSAERVTALRTFSLAPIDDRSSRLKLDGTVVGYQIAAEKPKSPKAGGSQ